MENFLLNQRNQQEAGLPELILTLTGIKAANYPDTLKFVGLCM